MQTPAEATLCIPFTDCSAGGAYTNAANTVSYTLA
jgi:hypothetical protein